MKKADRASKQAGKALITSFIAISGITLFLALRHKQGALLNNLGSTLSHLSEVFERGLMKKSGKKLDERETTLLELVDWIATGLDLWKKFKN